MLLLPTSTLAVLAAVLFRQSVGDALVRDFSGTLLEDANAVDDADDDEATKDDDIFFNGTYTYTHTCVSIRSLKKP